jgi:tetratricopeptide (TPR) repeat protein
MVSSPLSPSSPSVLQQHHQQQQIEYEQAIQFYLQHFNQNEYDKDDEDHHDAIPSSSPSEQYSQQQPHLDDEQQQCLKAAHVLQRLGDVLSAEHRADYYQAIRCYEMAEGLYQRVLVLSTTPTTPTTTTMGTRDGTVERTALRTSVSTTSTTAHGGCLPRIICHNLQQRAQLHVQHFHQIAQAIECHEEVVAMLLLPLNDGTMVSPCSSSSLSPTAPGPRGMKNNYKGNGSSVLSESMRVELVSRSLQQLGYLYLQQRQEQTTSTTTTPLTTINIQKLALGAWEEAWNVLQTALGRSTRLPKRMTPVRLGWQQRLGQVLYQLARLYLQGEEWRRAVDALQDAINLQTKCWRIDQLKTTTNPQSQLSNRTTTDHQHVYHAREELDQSLEAMTLLAQELESRSYYELSVTCWEKMVLVQSQKLGDHHLQVAHSMYQLARVMLFTLPVDDQSEDDSHSNEEDDDEEETLINSILDLFQGAYFIYHQHWKGAKLEQPSTEDPATNNDDNDLWYPSPQVGTMRTLLQLAKLQMEYGRFEDAISNYQQLLEALTMTPNHNHQVRVASTCFILTELGRACLELEQYSVARQCFLHALRSIPNRKDTQPNEEDEEGDEHTSEQDDDEQEARYCQINSLLQQADEMLQLQERARNEVDDDEVFQGVESEASDEEEDITNNSDDVSDECVFAGEGEIHPAFSQEAFRDVVNRKVSKAPSAMVATAAVMALRSRSKKRLLERWTEDSESRSDDEHTTETTSPDGASANSPDSSDVAKDEEEEEIKSFRLDTPSCSLGLSDDTKDDKWLLAFIGADHEKVASGRKIASPDRSGYSSYAGSESSTDIDVSSPERQVSCKSEKAPRGEVDMDSLNQMYKAHQVESTGPATVPYPMSNNLIDSGLTSAGGVSLTSSATAISKEKRHQPCPIREFSLFLTTTAMSDEDVGASKKELAVDASSSLLTDGDVLNSSALSSSLQSSPRRHRSGGSITSSRTPLAVSAEKRPPYQRLTSATDHPKPTASPKKRLVKALFPFRVGNKKYEKVSPPSAKEESAPIRPPCAIVKPGLRRISSGDRPPLSSARADIPKHPSMSSRSEPGVLRPTTWVAGDKEKESKSVKSPTCPPACIATQSRSWDDDVSQITFAEEDPSIPQQMAEGQWWWGVSLVSSLNQAAGVTDGILPAKPTNDKTKKLPFSFDSDEESDLFEFISETNSQTQEDSDSDTISLLNGNSVDSLDAIGPVNNSINRSAKRSPSSQSSERPNFLRQLRELRRSSMQHPKCPLAKKISKVEGSITNQKQQLGANNPSVARKLYALSRLHCKNRNFGLAVETALESIRIYKSCGDLVEASKVLHVLADAYSQQKQFKSALSCYIEAHRIELKQYGYYHAQSATTLNRIGNLYSKQGDFDLAMEQHQKALTILKECFGEELKNPLVSQTLIHIGSVYYRERNSLSTIKANMDGYRTFIETGMLEVIGRAHEDGGSYRMAIAFFEEKLQLLSNRADSKGGDVADTLHNLGRLSCKAGLYVEAIDFYERAVEQQLKLGCGKIQLATSRVLTGTVEYHLGQYNKALKMLQDALVVLRSELGENHEAVAVALYQIGVVQIALYQYDAAMKSLEGALVIQNRLFGKNDPATLQTRREIGNIHVACESGVNAGMEQFTDILETQRLVHGEHHPNIAETLYCIGNAHANKGDLEAALNYFEKCYYMQLEFLGEDHPLQSTALHAIARVQLQRGAVKKAMHILETVVANRKDALGEKHADVATTLSTKALCLVAKGDFADATKLFLEAKLILEEMVGTTHPVFGELHVAVGSMHLRKCHFDEAMQSIQIGLDTYNCAKLTEDHFWVKEAHSLMDRVAHDEMLCV